MTSSPLLDTPDTTTDKHEPELRLSPPPRPERPRWLLWLVGGVLLLGSVGYAGWRFFPSGGQQPGMAMKMPPPAVKWQVVTPDVVEEASALMGTLEAPKGTAIAPEIDGRVEAILVAEGERVTPGQALFRLDNDVLQSQRLTAQAALAQAQARLAELQAGSRQEDIAAAQAELTQAQARLTDAKAGASPEEIAQAQAQLDSAQASAELANERVKRFSDLQQEGVIALDTYDEQLKEQRQAIAEVQAAQRRLAQLKKGRQAEVDRLTAAVEAERQNVRRLQNGERPENIAQAKAQVAEAMASLKTVETRLEKTIVKAPFGGVVGYIPIKPGEYIQAGDRLTNLTENNQLTLNLSVPIAQASKLRKGLTVEVLDPQENVLAAGKISFISPDVEGNGQSVLARATLNNSDQQLLNRQLVETRVIWQRSQGLTVPTAAVSRIGGATFVYVADSETNDETGKPQLTAEQRTVTLGSLQGSRYEITSGLKPGEKVITAGLLKIQDGAAIRPQQPETKENSGAMR